MKKIIRLCLVTLLLGVVFVVLEEGIKVLPPDAGSLHAEDGVVGSNANFGQAGRKFVKSLDGGVSGERLRALLSVNIQDNNTVGLLGNIDTDKELRHGFTSS